ncbi:unnamed protein product, partial [Meganyctiphanes norvegica]
DERIICTLCIQQITPNNLDAHAEEKYETFSTGTCYALWPEKCNTHPDIFLAEGRICRRCKPNVIVYTIHPKDFWILSNSAAEQKKMCFTIENSMIAKAHCSQDNITFVGTLYAKNLHLTCKKSESAPMGDECL